MRCIFAGTPEVAVPVVEALSKSSHELVGVITRPDARRRRGRTLYPSPVAQWAEAAGVPVIKTDRITPEAHTRIADFQADVAVVVAYGALIPSATLSLPCHGWLNLHFSSLPRWRGAAPVQRAIQAGDTSVGACIFRLEEGLDTGPVLDCVSHPLSDTDTASQMLDFLARSGAQRMVSVLDQLAAGTACAVPQPSSGVTYAHKIEKEEAFIDFQQDASAVARRIHAVTDNPGAWTWRGEQRLKLGAVEPVFCLEAELASLPAGSIIVQKNEVLVSCDTGALRLGTVAPAGKGWMPAVAWARGARIVEGEQLGGSYE